MKIFEAREALKATIEDISISARALGIEVNSDCYLSDRDLFVIDDDKADEAAVIAAEVELKYDGADEKIFLECAVEVEFRTAVEGCLSTECQEDAVGTLLLDDFSNEVCRYRQEIYLVRNAFRCLDRSNVGVDEH